MIQSPFKRIQQPNQSANQQPKKTCAATQRRADFRGYTLCIALALFGASLGSEASAQQPIPSAVEQQVLLEETQSIRKLVLQSGQFSQRMERYGEYVKHLDGLNVMLDAAGPILETLRDVQDSGAIDLLAIAGALDGGLDMLPQVLTAVEELHGMAAQLSTLGAQLKLLTSDIDTLLATEHLTLPQLQSLRTASIPTGKQALQSFSTTYQQLVPMFTELDQVIASLEQEMNALFGQALGQLGGQLGGGNGQQLGAIIGGLGGMGGGLGGLGLPSVGDLFSGLKELRAELDDMARKVPDDIAFLSSLEARLLDAEAHLAYAQSEHLIATNQTDQARQMLDLISQTYPQSKWATTSQQRLKSLTQADLERAAAANPDAASSLPLAVVTPGGGLAWWAVVLLVLAASAGGAAALHFLQRRRAAQPARPARPAKT